MRLAGGLIVRATCAMIAAFAGEVPLDPPVPTNATTAAAAVAAASVADPTARRRRRRALGRLCSRSSSVARMARRSRSSPALGSASVFRSRSSSSVVMGIPPSKLFENSVHPDAHRSGRGADDRSDLVEREAGSVAQADQVLLLRCEQTNRLVQLRSPLEGQEPLLQVRLGRSHFVAKQRVDRSSLGVPHVVARDLEQPAREGAIPAEEPKVLERSCKHRARDVLTAGLVAYTQPHITENTVEVPVVQR